MRQTAVLLAIVLSARAAPALPSAPLSTDVAPSPLDDPAAVGDEVDLAPEQLVAIDGGFVAARFDDADRLQLIWVRPGDEGHELVVLASSDEARADGGHASAPTPSSVRTGPVLGELVSSSGRRLGPQSCN